MYISDQKNTCVCQCGADCLNIMERIKITGESQNKRRTKSKFRYSATVSLSRLSCGLVEHLLDRYVLSVFSLFKASSAKKSPSRIVFGNESFRNQNVNGLASIK